MFLLASLTSSDEFSFSQTRKDEENRTGTYTASSASSSSSSTNKDQASELALLQGNLQDVGYDYDGDGQHLVEPPKPHLSYSKYLTMQEKRVIVTINYSESAGLKPYFLTIAKKLKEKHPDVLIERNIFPSSSELSNKKGGDDKDQLDTATFEVRVDGKVVLGKGPSRRQADSRSIYVSMQEMSMAIARARKRRRPSTTVYGSDKLIPGTSLSLESTSN